MLQSVTHCSLFVISRGLYCSVPVPITHTHGNTHRTLKKVRLNQALIMTDCKVNPVLEKSTTFTQILSLRTLLRDFLVLSTVILCYFKSPLHVQRSPVEYIYSCSVLQTALTHLFFFYFTCTVKAQVCTVK